MDNKDKKVVLFSKKTKTPSSRTAPSNSQNTVDEDTWMPEPWEDPEAWKQVALEPEEIEATRAIETGTATQAVKTRVPETRASAAARAAAERAAEREASEAGGKKGRKKKSLKKRLIITGSVIIVLILLYITAVFSNIPFIKKYREIYIGTAMDTYSHKWLATFFIPTSVIEKVMADKQAFIDGQKGIETSYAPSPSPSLTPSASASASAAPSPSPSKADPETIFFTKFYMLDKASFNDYISKNPDVMKDGYDKLLINEASLDKKGTTIRTKQGEQVLVVDPENGILIVKVTGDDFQGKMAIIRNAAQVRLGVSKAIGSYGQPVGDIAKAYNAVLAINASGFADPEWNGNGGSVVGLCIAGGKVYNKTLGQGYLPIGFGLDNLLYIGVSASKMTYRDAVEFLPALIVNGKDVSAGAENFFGTQPRSVIAQAADGTVFLLTIDGRQPGWSLGASVVDASKILLKYDAVQAANLDGGSSTIMIYRDEIITRTSGAQGYGRWCPDAFIVDYANNVKDNSVG